MPCAPMSSGACINRSQKPCQRNDMARAYVSALMRAELLTPLESPRLPLLRVSKLRGGRLGSCSEANTIGTDHNHSLRLNVGHGETKK